MAKFRKKPVVIDAYHMLDTRESKDHWPDWLREAWEKPTTDVGALCFSILGGDRHEMYVNTFEGQLTVSPGDWIIRGIKGELYPCKPDVFAATYEQVE